MEKLKILPWKNHAAAQAVLAAFAKAKTPIRFVGGCVRDAFVEIIDPNPNFDMATTALPEQTTKILQDAGIKAVPTGIAFGTITAVVDGYPVEITTLREDVDTDGRHATVKFGTDWNADAARRDFTINALYADDDGTIYDYFGGMNDAKARRVRFIGDAVQRITEDYLRIMRFFRFTARYGDVPDSDGLAACTQLRDNIKNLARERIWMELEKILILSKPLRALQPMIDAGVMQQIISGDHYALKILGRLADYEHDNNVDPVAIIRLAALNAAPPAILQNTLLLSNRNLDWLMIADESLRVADLTSLRKLWYHLDDKMKPQTWLQNVALLLLADDDVQSDGGEHLWPVDLFAMASAWSAPVFPLAGADVIARGIAAGPEVGSVLTQIENWWLAENFKPSRAECLNKLQEILG